MRERLIEHCEHCKFLRRLKHNFEVGKGYEESFCCVIFAKEKDGFASEVEKGGSCEIFREKEGASDGEIY